MSAFHNDVEARNKWGIGYLALGLFFVLTATSQVFNWWQSVILVAGISFSIAGHIFLFAPPYPPFGRTGEKVD